MTWLIVATGSRWQKNSIVEAKRNGFKVFTIDADPNAPAFKISDAYLCVDILDIDKISLELERLGIIPSGVSSFTSEAGVISAAIIREKYGLSGSNMDVCRNFTNKARQREIWDLEGVPGPNWVVIETFDEFKSAINSLGYPCISKPVDSAGSRGITKLSGQPVNIYKAFKKAMRYSKTGAVIVEEFVEGKEYTLEALAYKEKVFILAVTEKKKVPGTNNTVAFELASANLPNVVLKNLESIGRLAFESLGLKEGPGHAEIIIGNKGKVIMVEAAARGGGFLIFDKLVPIISGINIASLTGLIACNKIIPDKLNLDNLLKQWALLRWIPSKKGTVRSIKGLTKANEQNQTIAGNFVEKGDMLNAPKTDGDRMGFIITWGKSFSEIQEKADFAEGFINFKVEKG